MGFKIGDKVRMRIMNEDRASDLEADYMCDLEEGDITGQTYDQLREIMSQVQSGESPVFIVSEVCKDGYGLRLGKFNVRYMFEELALESVDE